MGLVNRGFIVPLLQVRLALMSEPPKVLLLPVCTFQEEHRSPRTYRFCPSLPSIPTFYQTEIICGKVLRTVWRKVLWYCRNSHFVLLLMTAK